MTAFIIKKNQIPVRNVCAIMLEKIDAEIADLYRKTQENERYFQPMISKYKSSPNQEKIDAVLQRYDVQALNCFQSSHEHMRSRKTDKSESNRS